MLKHALTLRGLLYSTRLKTFDPQTSSFTWCDCFEVTGQPFNFLLVTLNAGSVAMQTAASGNPGILRISTDTAANDVTGIGSSANTASTVHSADIFDIIVIAKRVNNNTQAGSRIGLFGSTVTGDPPANGIYFERLTSDTQWFFVTRSASIQTRSAAIVTSDTSFHMFRIRRLGNGMAASIDGAGEVIQNTNIPSVAMEIAIQQKTTNTTSQPLDVDYIDLLVAGLTRSIFAI